MKRLICFLALTAYLSLAALAAPVKLDAIIHVRAEYNDTLATLQIPKNESNNNLSSAYLHWACSPADYSVYLGVLYCCTDHAIEDGLTGVEVRINDVLVGTVFADGTTLDVDHDRFELESAFDVETGPPYEVACEVRVGVKFWPDGEIVAGIRILDFSGNPSNFYQQLVYTPYTTTTKESESTTSLKTTTEKDTTTVAVTQTTARTVRTTAPVITASPKRETTAAAAAAQTKRDAKAETTAAAIKTTKAKTTNAATEKRSKTTKPSTERSTSAVPVTAAVSPATTEPALTATETTAVSNAQMYSELNKVKIVGTALVVVILTVAIMSSVFLGMRQKQDPEKPHTPQEEYEDFG